MELFKELATPEAIRCSKEYLKRHNYEILKESWQSKFGVIDLIAVDTEEEENLVLIKIKIQKEEELNEIQGIKYTKSDRETFEKLAFDFVASTSVIEMPLRLDVINLTPCNEQKAILRHHVNVLHSANELERLDDIFLNCDSRDIVNLLKEYEDTQNGKKPIIYRAYQEHICQLIDEEIQRYIKNLEETDKSNPDIEKYKNLSVKALKQCIEGIADDVVELFSENLEEYFSAIKEDIF